MIGFIFHLALHDNTPPPIEVYWAYLVHAHRGALEGLALAKRDPTISSATLAALAVAVVEIESMLNRLERLRPKTSPGAVTTWETSSAKLEVKTSKRASPAKQVSGAEEELDRAAKKEADAIGVFGL